FRPSIRTRYGMELEDLAGSFAGQNYRMSEITGAVLVEQWKRLAGMTAVMRKNHRNLRDRLVEAMPNIKLRAEVDKQGNLGANIGLLFPTPELAVKFAEAIRAENIVCRFMYDGRTVYRNDFILNQRTAEKNNFPFDYP